MNDNVSGGLQLDVLGTLEAGAHLIIGPPGAGSTYSNANGSIAGNGPHNAFLNQTATFVIDIAGLTAADLVTGAIFSFGETAGNNVPSGTTIATPEPASLAVFGAGVAAAVAMRRRKKKGV